jgi:hypothetical protein
MSASSHVIVTAADAAFYELATDTVASIRDKAQGRDIPIVIFDLGLTATQRERLRSRRVDFVVPGWDYAFHSPPPEWFKAMTARTRLPKWVPGFEFYLWIDADAWVQRWETIELLLDAADRCGFAAVAEADRAYSDIQAATADGKPVSTLQTRIDNLRTYFGDDVVRRAAHRATMNCGVFCARHNSSIWEAWPRLMTVALRSRRVSSFFFAEQTAMNVALSYESVPFARLPAMHNWLLTGAMPRVGDGGELVHPDFPHESLGIIHRAAHTKFSRERLLDLDGRVTSVGTGYRRASTEEVPQNAVADEIAN